MTQTTKETADQDIVEWLRGKPMVVNENGYTGISVVGGTLLNKAADEIEQLRKDLNTKKLAIGALVHAYDNEWKVGDAMVRARKIMADGYDPWVEIERLREALQQISDSYSPDHSDEMKITMFRGCVVIARDALEEKE